MKIVIIGGGLIGLLTARELSLAGQEVTVIEQGQFGEESSWAGGGILSPLYPWEYADSVNALALWSQQNYPDLVKDLVKTSNIDPQWTKSGLLVLDEDKFEVAQDWATSYGLDCQVLDARQLQQDEPELIIGPHTGLLFPDIAQVRNPRMIKSMLGSCRNLGIELVENTTVKSLLIKDNIVTGVVTELAEVTADKVVVCAGAWSAHLLTQVGIKVDVKPLRGQMIMFRTPPGLINRITLFKGHYLIPRRDGRVLVGSTLEDVGFDKSTTADALEELKQFAQQLFPVLNQYEIERQWSGLRPATPNGVPYISAIPEMVNLYINAGHFRNGVILGPASARLAADLILEREPSLEPSFYEIHQPH